MPQMQPDRPRLPTTRTLWSWQVDDVQAPGWQETVLVGGVTNGQHTILRLARGGRWPSPDLVASEIDEHGQPGWHSEALNASGHLDGFGACLGKTLGHWAQTGQLHGSTPTTCAASFSFLDVTGSALNPDVRQAQNQAHELLLAIAMGETPDDAYTQATGRPRTSKGKKFSP